MYDHHFRGMDKPGKGCQSCLWLAQMGKIITPFPRSRLRFWSRETASAVSSCVSLLILHTQAQYGAYSRGSPDFHGGAISIYRQPPLGQSRVSQVTRLRTDVVHCRTSAGTGTVVLKIVPVTGAAFSCLITDQSVRLYFPTHPLGGMKWAC